CGKDREPNLDRSLIETALHAAQVADLSEVLIVFADELAPLVLIQVLFNKRFDIHSHPLQLIRRI
ncbi:MAG TPA: hypothetical protein VIG57_17130, partial [Candidatus Entotheonella sp.]